MLDRVADRLGKIGADPADDNETRLRKALLVRIAVLILPISFLWAGLYLAFGAWAGSLALVYAAISIGSIALFAGPAITACSCPSSSGISCWRRRYR